MLPTLVPQAVWSRQRNNRESWKQPEVGKPCVESQALRHLDQKEVAGGFSGASFKSLTTTPLEELASTTEVMRTKPPKTKMNFPISLDRIAPLSELSMSTKLA